MRAALLIAAVSAFLFAFWLAGNVEFRMTRGHEVGFNLYAGAPPELQPPYN